MSKAFTKDESDPSVTEVVSARAPLPSGTPNYVTPRGLALLQGELGELEAVRAALGADDASARRALGARFLELEARIASALVVYPATHPHDRVRFGARVRVSGADGGERAFQIVGVDEANPAEGRIAFTAPLARALLGTSLGDAVRFQSPRGVEELEVIEIRYAATDSG